MKFIELKTNDDLQALEKALAVVSIADVGEEIRIHLARRLKMHFFKESRIAALLITAAQRGRLVIQDWYNEWRPSDAVEYLRASPANFAAVICASQMTNDKGGEPSFKLGEIRDQVARDGGILEPHNVSEDKAEMVGKSLTFCAMDPDSIEPLALSGFLYEKKRFIEHFITLKKTYLDPYPNIRDQELASYVFELYQNGFVHGRLSENDQVIPGLRFLSIRRHGAVNRETLQPYATGFPQLAQFIEQHTSLSKSPRLFEVSVSDQGIGMLRRFLAKRPEFAAQTNSRGERLQLLKRLLLEPLTSNKNTHGAGYGLEKALTAVKALNGFVSLRTDSFWLYAAFPGNQEHASLGLSEVILDYDLAPVAGTHFNALIPLR